MCIPANSHPAVLATLAILVLAVGSGCQKESGTEAGKSQQAVPEAAETAVAAAKRRLGKVEYFITPPSGEESYQAVHRDMMLLLESDSARHDFTDLLASRNRAASLYGLVGLYFCDPVGYRATVVKAIQEQKEAEVKINDLTCTSGDGYAVPVESLLKVEQGALLEYGESIGEYCGRKQIRLADLKIDFYGGGIPSAWMDRGFLELTSRAGSDIDFGEMGAVSSSVPYYLEEKEEFNRVWGKAVRRAMHEEGR